MNNRENGILLYICRHGQSAHNQGSEKEHTFAGSLIDNELSENGIQTAHRVAQKIKEMGGCDVVVSSTLLRSRQTADIVAKQLGAQVATLENLEEINIGDFVGHNEDEVRNLYPKAAKSFYEGDVPNWNFPNGEKYEDISSRIDSALLQLTKSFSTGAKVALIGHGMINRVLFYKIMPNEKHFWQERSYPHDRIVTVNL